MPSFDTRTVILVAFLINGLFFATLFALYRSLANTLRGLGKGVWASTAWAAGSGLVLARGLIPDSLSLLGGNLAISGGILLMYAALNCYMRPNAAQSRWLAGVAVLGVLGMSGCFLLGTYADVLAFTTAYNAVFLFAAATAVQGPKSSGFAQRFTAFSLWLAAATSGLRFLVCIFGDKTVSLVFDPTQFQKVYLSLLAFSIIATLMGFTLLTYELLNEMLAAANTNLESKVAERTADLRLEIERKQSLERLVFSTAEAERLRIGTELHDDLGQRLTGISLVSEVLSRELWKIGHVLAGHADAIQEASSDAIAQVRRLAHGLMPVFPEPEGFTAALALLAKTSTVPGMLCKFECEEAVEIKNQDVVANLFRIAQEAVSNAIRHSEARTVTIRLDVESGKVVFSVTDDGLGFAWPLLNRENMHGRGLGIMDFRASLIQYRFNVKCAPGQGCSIRVIEC